jgi:hypothetical protein
MFASLNLLTNSEKIFLVNFFRLRTCKQCEKAAYTLQKRTNTRNFKQIFSEKELRGHSPNYNIHVSVNDLYIIIFPRFDLPILLLEICGLIPGIYKSLTDT